MLSATVRCPDDDNDGDDDDDDDDDGDDDDDDGESIIIIISSSSSIIRVNWKVELKQITQLTTQTVIHNKADRPVFCIDVYRIWKHVIISQAQIS